jgi:aminoglycoside phosphotransferase family enzyme/predicted kinase
MSGAQQEVIAFLSTPAAHGLPEGGEVERVETHASIVFLAGDTAVKLKKSVRYPYLDYSTVALRRRFCEAELSLNQRTAPLLYRRVRAVTRGAEGGLVFDGAGPALDWVVEMRRFDQTMLLSAVAAAGRLTRPLLEALVEAIAGFHAAAEPVAGFGGAAAVANTVAMSDESLRDARLPAPLCDRLLAASRAALARIGEILDRRRDAGKVRRCHGDLHLGNICVLDGRPTLFDGIEFSDNFACIDTLYDLAFLLMDLWHRGMKDAANLVLNRYLDHGEEGEGLAALPLFLSMRAAVRAYVTAIKPGAEARAEAEAYLDLALELLTPLPAWLVAIGGLSGTGKSTVAAAVAPALGAAPGARLLRSDVLRKRRARMAATERLPPEAYSVEAAASLYAEMRALAAQTLTAGSSVIVDAVSARPEERAGFEAVARAAGAGFRGLWLEADPAVLAPRLEGRRNDASDATPAVLQQQLGYALGPIAWTRIDAGGDPEAVLARVRQALAG